MSAWPRDFDDLFDHRSSSRRPAFSASALVAKVVVQRMRPSYAERKAVFRPTGRPEPSREPFPIVSKGGGRPTF
jgi:hypothetical protein